MKNLDEFLVASGLDFNISKKQLFAKAGRKQIATPYFGLFNDKTGVCLNGVKSSYTVSQNRDVVSKVLEGMAPFGDKLKVHNAGALNGGKKVFMQLAIEGLAKVGDDIIERYVTIIDSNDGSSGLSVGIGDFTMSCSNQFFHFYKSGMRFRHTKSIDGHIETLPLLIEEALGKSMEMVKLYNKLASSPLTRGLADQLVKELAGLDRLATPAEMEKASGKKVNAMNSLYDMIAKETAQKGDTLWGLHSGVTRWTTHAKAAPVRENGQLESSMTSTNYKTNQKSLEFVMEQL